MDQQQHAIHHQHRFFGLPFYQHAHAHVDAHIHAHAEAHAESHADHADAHAHAHAHHAHASFAYTYGIPIPNHGPVEYIDEVAILGPSVMPTPRSIQYGNHSPAEYVDQVAVIGPWVMPPTTQYGSSMAEHRRSGGLSVEEITEHLHITTHVKGKGKEDDDVCGVCLEEYDKNQKMGRLECGHSYHAPCIKEWLLRKNVCPMCRATALTV